MQPHEGRRTTAIFGPLMIPGASLWSTPLLLAFQIASSQDESPTGEISTRWMIEPQQTTTHIPSCWDELEVAGGIQVTLSLETLSIILKTLFRRLLEARH